MRDIDTADYARLKRAYLELLDLHDDARAARLAAIDEQSPTLAAALRRQLDAAGHVLPLLDRAGAAVHAPQLPHYRIVRELGRGGMGVVWLAERSLGDARQQVALKQIGHAHWSDDDLRRFQRERRILAGLDHPNIAALVDGGTDDHGQAYLATQFVDGLRLDRWAAARAPDLRMRVALLRDVAAAVAYAHGRLVVHRDLKPANILVTDAGMPRLLDFGIARALHEDAVTAEGPSQMTLRYAAPEQVASEGSDGGVGVDIYALGVILYELIAGQSPYRDAAGPAALVHAILHDVPPAPSRIAGATPGANADLDAICMKALRKPVDARYVSAAALRADLDRWLAREPVDARRGERGYRVRAFARRHWPGLVATAVLLVSAVAAGAWEWRSQREQIAALKVERDKARAISHFFDELFAAAAPSAVASGEMSARELLLLAAKRLDDEGITATLGDDARAALYRAASGVMERQGLAQEAVTMLDRAIALWRTVQPPQVDDLVGALHERARMAYLQGQLDVALRLQTESIDVLDAAGSTDYATQAALLNSLSVMQIASGQADAGMASLERGAALLRPHLPKGEVYYANNRRNIAMHKLYAGRAEEGLADAREAVALLQRIRPERTRDLYGAQVVEAAALRELGRGEESEALYRDTIARLRAWSAGGTAELVEALLSYAKLLLVQQRWSDAETLLREAEAAFVAQGGELHTRALGTRGELALIAIGREQWLQAETTLSEIARKRADAGPAQASVLAFERAALAYVTCRAAPRIEPAHVAALQAAADAMRRDPPLPLARLKDLDAWQAACSIADSGETTGAPGAR